MLKNIPAILPPELLKLMSEMGHGDELVLTDANFRQPAMRNAWYGAMVSVRRNCWKPYYSYSR